MWVFNYVFFLFNTTQSKIVKIVSSTTTHGLEFGLGWVGLDLVELGWVGSANQIKAYTT